MKSAVIDNEGMIWGTGIDDASALKDAYTWLNQDQTFADYEEFTSSKLYDQLTVLEITDAAYTLVDEAGGDYTAYRDGCKYVRDGKLIMTKDEYEERTHDGTYIRVKKCTRERLGNLGRKHDSYDRIINRLIDLHGDQL